MQFLIVNLAFFLASCSGCKSKKPLKETAANDQKNEFIQDDMIQKAEDTERPGAPGQKCTFLAEQLKKLQAEPSSNTQVSYINDIDPQSKHTALSQAAIEAQDAAIVKALLKMGADPNQDIPALNGNILAYMVFMLVNANQVKSQFPIFEALLNGGGDPSKFSNGTSTPSALKDLLMRFSATNTQFWPLVKSFLNKTKDVNAAIDADGNTPLHWAVKKKHVSAVKWLIQKSADPNKGNAAGETPKSIALTSGDDVNNKEIKKTLGIPVTP